MPRSAIRPAHPGRTPAQRRALDAIGCGNFLPPMHPKVRDALLAEGLIVPAAPKQCRDKFGAYTVPQYEMPLDVHFLWCSAVAATDEEMVAL